MALPTIIRLKVWYSSVCTYRQICSETEVLWKKLDSQTLRKQVGKSSPVTLIIFWNSIFLPRRTNLTTQNSSKVRARAVYTAISIQKHAQECKKEKEGKEKGTHKKFRTNVNTLETMTTPWASAMEAPHLGQYTVPPLHKLMMLGIYREQHNQVGFAGMTGS